MEERERPVEPEEPEEPDEPDESQEMEPENEEQIRTMILEQLASLEPSDVSDEENFQVRLSCILEDDESECIQDRNKEFPKNEAVTQKMGERDKPSVQTSSEESESGDFFALNEYFPLRKYGEGQVTDLDEPSPKNSDEDDRSEKTEIQMKTDEDNGTRKALAEETERDEEDEEEEEEEEEEDDEKEEESPFEMKKVKSSKNVLDEKIVPKRTEFSSDSSEIDISISNEKPSAPIAEEGGEGGGTIPDEEMKEDNPIFAKVSKDYMEKTREEERMESVERELLEMGGTQGGILQVVHLRSKSPRVYSPVVPPETYLWEELKRIRGKGGYPWTYLDKPPFDEEAWKKYMEHEYEPINPPPLSTLRRKEKEQDAVGESTNKSGIPQSNSHFVRDRSAKKMEEDVENVRTEEDMEIEGIASTQDLQDQIENRFLAQTPTTTASRTDADVNTSMLDSSGLEDVPLKRASRSKIRSQARGIQQKLRNQAGKIRSKIRNMPKPSLTAKERQKDGTAQERHRFRMPQKPKFNLPERPKFKLPERPKFNLPERPKFHFPERPKFNLPERPKFNLPERPKFNLPERPKLHLPERPKFNLPERPKFHLPERPKFNLPERPKFNLPDMSKFHLPERPKIHLPERPKINMPSFVRPLRERQERTPGKGIFELEYPKIFTKKSKQRQEYITSSPKKTRGSTPPPKMHSDQPEAPQRKKVPVGQRWLKKMDDIKFADEGDPIEARDSRRSDRSESFSDLKDKDLGAYMEDLDDSRFPTGGRKTLSMKSSSSHFSDRDVESLASSEGRRKGVLEEIDSDEFFLRQKGISQEDIDMGKYLSHEIREAFRSPEVNALARMDYDFDAMDVEKEPMKPNRRRSFKKSNLKKHFESDPALSENPGFKTYPPRRPDRKSRSQSKSLVNEEAVIAESRSMYENEQVPYQEENPDEYYKSPGPVREFEYYKVPKPIAQVTPMPHKRKKAGKKSAEDVTDLGASFGEMAASDQSRSQPPDQKFWDGQQEFPDEGISEMEREHDYIIPSERVADKVPTPPRRTKSLTRSLRSSRSLRSEGGSREAIVFVESQPGEVEVEAQPFVRSEMPRFDNFDAADDDPGYATVGKPIVARPARQKKEKPSRAPPPRKKRELTGFHTVPRKMPTRPIRNYSTLGPSRPPRKTQHRSNDGLGQSYVEIESESFIQPLRYEECHGSNRALQKDEVIEKMKSRPLPPPPRPPRQKSKGPEDAPEETEEAKISIALLKGEPIPVEVEALVHAPPTEPVEEVCVSTQTDPLPDDFLLEVEEDVIQEFSHEQLKIQQQFLEEMKREEAEPGPSGIKREEEPIEARLEMELLEELRREAENNKEKETKKVEPFDADLGYASLSRRPHKQQEPEPTVLRPEPIHVPVIPDIQTSVEILRTDKLNVKELQVEKLNVKELEAQSFSASNIQTSRLEASQIDARSGNLNLDNLQIPPYFIRQIVDSIPWSELRRPEEISRPEVEQQQEQQLPPPTPPTSPTPPTPPTPPAPPTPKMRRKQHRRSHYSDEGDVEEERAERPRRRSARNERVAELSMQLATACASSGARTIRSIASRIQNVEMKDKNLLLRIILGILAFLVAAFLILAYDRPSVLHHHWDFQFPPQPPPRQPEL